MTATASTPGHRVSELVAHLRTSLAEAAEAAVWTLSATETIAVIEDVQAATAQLAELQARLLVHAETLDVPGHTGATSTANWFAHHTRATRPAAHRTMRLAHGLGRRPLTRTALAEGRVRVEQAEEVLRVIDQLPDTLHAAQVDRVEEHLLDLAAHHDARDLKTLGRHALEVVAPEVADAHEAKLLERQERATRAATSLYLWDTGDGRVHGRFTVDALTGAALRTALQAIAAPRHQAATGTTPNAARPQSGSARRSSSTSSATRSRGCRRPVGSAPPSSPSSPWTRCWAD